MQYVHRYRPVSEGLLRRVNLQVSVDRGKVDVPDYQVDCILDGRPAVVDHPLA
jgi:hypothetical protein